MEKTNKKSFKAQYEELVLFRKNHALKKLSHLDKEWTYYSCGRGKHTIIILPGGIGTGEAAFYYIQALENWHRVISPIYPSINTMDELVEGLNKIIEKESAEHITLFGASFGGMLAQCYMKKYPQKIENLILAHTTTITKDSSEEELKKMADNLNRNIKLINIFPEFMMRNMLNRKFKGLSKKMTGEEEFWDRYFKEVVKTYDKKDIISSLQSMLDFVCNYRFEYGLLSNWQGKILILEADDDTAFSERQKEILKLLYKDAEVHSERGFGHLTSFMKRDLYIKLIDEFANVN